MSELFKKLMEQIDMPLDMRQSSAFSSADIREVKVHSVSRLWEFHFSFAEILPIEIYRELSYRLVNTFKQADIRATFDIQAETVDFSQPLLQAYYEEAFEHAPCDSASFKASFSKLKVSYDGTKLLIEAPAFVNNDHFRKNHLPNLARQFEAFGFGKLTIDMVSDEAMTQALREDFTSIREAMVEKRCKKIMRRLNLWNLLCHQLKKHQNLNLILKNVPNSAVQVSKMPKSHQWLKSQQKKTELSLKEWFLTLKREQLVQDVTLLILK